jgi:hypothetical protein
MSEDSAPGGAPLSANWVPASSGICYGFVAGMIGMFCATDPEIHRRWLGVSLPDNSLRCNQVLAVFLNYAQKTLMD